MSISSMDTIIAIASPLGNSHQAIIRLSGPASLALVEASFTPHQDKWDSFSTVAGHLTTDGLKIPVRLYVMKSPYSYTREDIIEIHTLGVLPLLNPIIEDFTRRGARLAQPGEFTQRAFVNGRLDLLQAEAVLGIIQSRNERELALAHRQLSGQFSEHLSKIKQTLVDLLAQLELSLDFSDQDIDILPLAQFKSRLSKLLEAVARFLSSETRPVYKEGVKVIICGRPNVGKSSLFNRLLGKKRALVTVIPGTTTDVLAGPLKIADTRFRLFDTAGLGQTDVSNNCEPACPVRRKASDEVHQMASARTKLLLKNADIWLLVLDGNRPLTEDDRTIFDNLNRPQTILIINKIDLPREINLRKVRQFLGKNLPVLQLSTRTGKGLTHLKKELTQLAAKMQVDKSSSEYSINARHRISLTRTYEGLKAALKITETETGQHIKSGDTIALELREALNGIGEVLGEITSGDILNHIFSQFCIGK